jgi:hypothetical protein
MLAILLASLGAVVVDAARQQQQLREAIKSRQVIGEAIGEPRVRMEPSVFAVPAVAMSVCAEPSEPSRARWLFNWSRRSRR